MQVTASSRDKKPGRRLSADKRVVVPKKARKTHRPA